MQVTVYKLEWITRGTSVAAVSVHREETAVLVRPIEEKRNKSWNFNKHQSLTELPRKLNLVTTAYDIYDSHLGCDAVSDVGQWLSTCKWNSEAWGPFTKRHGVTSQKKCKNLKYRIHFCFIFYYDQQMHNESTNYHSYTFRHYCVILMVHVISTLPGYTSISNAAVGNTI
jgi:hypothetical protein